MINKKSRIIILKKSILYILTISLMLIVTVFSKTSVFRAKEALRICAENIIPSLFPFFVLSQFLINTGFANTAGRFLAPFMRTLFKTGGAGGIAFFIGIISGYPSGAKAICELTRSGALQKEESERLLPYCNNSGPLFIIGTIGLGMFRNIKAGMLLYIIHIISAIITGISLRFLSVSKTKTKNTLYKTVPLHENYGAAFSHSIKESVSTILSVCGFIVFFSSITAPFLSLLGKNMTGNILMGIAEITGGILEISQNCDINTALPVISALLGFGGICVTLQVMGIVKTESLSMKPYILGKLFQSAISFILCKVALKKMLVTSAFSIDKTIDFRTGNLGAAITSVFIISAFYFFVLALRKNFKRD
ncbi:MAG: hypothetical protein E7407_03650 [Ruminococcaceae bacterium]|nr:hypothetical protein [Oscillospiraceae bacterium]